MKLTRTILRFPLGFLACLALLIGCQSTSGPDPLPSTAMTARGSVEFSDSLRLPDFGVWRTNNASRPADTGRGSITCITGKTEGKKDCGQDFALKAVLGSDLLVQDLYTLGVHFATFKYSQNGTVPQLTFLRDSIRLFAMEDTLIREFNRQYKGDKKPTAADLTAYYAKLLLDADVSVKDSALPKGMVADTVKKILVQVAAQSGVTAKALAAKALLGLTDESMIRTITDALVKAGAKIDTTKLYPPVPVRVIDSVKVASDLTEGEGEVAVSGSFAWESRALVRRQLVKVVTAEGVEDENIRVIPDGVPDLSSGSWVLTGHLTLQAKKGAKIGLDTLIVSVEGDSGKAISRTTFRVLRGDIVPPALSITQPSGDTEVVHSMDKITVVAQASDAKGVAEVKIGNTVLTTAPYSAVVDLAVGYNFIYVQAKDHAGNVSLDTVVVQRKRSTTSTDATNPVITLRSPSKDTTAVATGLPGLELSWTATDDVGIKRVTLNDSEVTGTAGAYTKAVSLQDGDNTFEIRAFDDAGNAAKKSVIIHRPADLTKAGIVPAADRAVGADIETAILTWTITNSNKAKSATLNGDPIPVGASITKTVRLDPGPNVFKLVVKDTSGTEVSSSVTITRAIDTALLGVSHPSDRTVSPETESDTLTWTILNPAKAVSATLNTKPVTVGATIRETVSLVAGKNEFILAIKDASGKTVSDTVIVARAADLAGPSVVWVAPTKSVSVDATVTSYVVQVKVTDASGVESVSLNGALTSKDAADVYAMTLALPNPDGNPINVVVVAKDAKGNITRDSQTVTRNVPSGTNKPIIKLLKPTDSVGNALSFETAKLYVEADITDALLSIDPKSVTIGGVAAMATGSVYAAEVPVAPTGTPTTITIKASNTGTIASTLNVVVTRAKDAVKPTITPDSATKTQSVDFETTNWALSWTVSDNHKLASLMYKGLTEPVAAKVTKSLPLDVGENRAVLIAIDSTGNTDSSVVVITRKKDATPPVVTITKPAATSTVAYGTASIDVTASAVDAGSGLKSLTIGGMPAPLAGGTIAVALGAGKNVIKVLAIDNAENSATDSVVVTVASDATGPELTITSPKDGDLVTYGATTVSVSASATDAGGLASITIGTKTCTSSPCTGEYTLGSDGKITVTAKDAKGNTTSKSVTVKFDTDKTAPVLTRGASTKDAVVPGTQTTLAVSWTVTDNDLKSVKINGVAVTGTSNVYSSTITLSGNGQTITIEAKDGANTSTDAIKVQRVSAPTLTAGGSFVGAKSVTISAPVGTIEYSTDGEKTWKAYTAALSLTDNTTIVARASLDGVVAKSTAVTYNISYDVTLSSVKVDGVSGTISGATITVPALKNIVSAVSATATATDAGATVTIGGGVSPQTLTFENDVVTTQIVVTNHNSSKTYSMQVKLATVGTFTDSRTPARSYAAVKIGTQWWMSENLKYTAGATIGGCSNGDPVNCTTYGRNYNWSEVSATPSVCPAGWHLPTPSEWGTLISYTGGDSLAAWRLLAKKDGGTDDYGFGAVLGGIDNYNDGIGGAVGWFGEYWAATALFDGSTETEAVSYRFYQQSPPTTVMRMLQFKTSYLSVRCMKNF